MDIGQTFERDVRFVEDGQVTTWDGRPVYLRDLIKRRWGWPKKAAVHAAAVLKEQYRTLGTPVRLYVQQPERGQQQQALFTVAPELLDFLLSGLANGSSKEAEDCDHEIVGVNVSFVRGVDDDGLVRDITSALAKRFAISVDDVREVTAYNTSGPVVTLRVDTSCIAQEAGVEGCSRCLGVGMHFAGCERGAPNVPSRPDSGAT